MPNGCRVETLSDWLDALTGVSLEIDPESGALNADGCFFADPLTDETGVRREMHHPTPSLVFFIPLHEGRTRSRMDSSLGTRTRPISENFTRHFE